MSFIEQLFPREISMGAEGGPDWSTEVNLQPNGFRSTKQKQLYPLHEYDVGHAARDNATFELLRAWPYVTRGRFRGFRFEAPDNYIVTRSISSLTLITGTTYQLNRTFTVGAEVYTWPIYKPKASPVVVVYDGSGAVLGSTTDTTTGRVTVPTGTPVTWAGQFDIPMAFKDDRVVFSILGGQSKLVTWPSIMLREIREVWSA